MATKEQLKTWIVENQDKQGKEGKDGQDFEKVKAKYISLRGEDKPTKTGDYSTGAERARTVAQGVTLGFADEIEAGARSLFSDRKYKDIRDEIRQDTKDFRTDNPGQALALEMAGGVVIPGGILRAGAKALVGKAVAPVAKKGKTTLSQSKVTQERLSKDLAPGGKYSDPIADSANTYGRAFKNNAALGATYGAGASESESVSGIAADATLGGAVGGVAGSALLGLGRQFRPLVNRDAIPLAREATARAEGRLPGETKKAFDPLIARNANFVTRGQAETSNVARNAEGQLSNVSKTIKEGRARGLEGYNIQVFNDVFDLAKQGSTRGAEQARKLAQANSNKKRATVVRETIKDNYKVAYSTMKLNSKDKTLNDDLNNWLINAGKGKTDKVKKELAEQFRSIMGTLKTVPNKPGKASAARIQALFKNISNKNKVTIKSSENNNIAADLMDFNGSQSVYKQLDDIIKNHIRKNTPDAMDNFDATQYAYRAVVNLEEAVSRSVGKKLFTPTQVVTAFSAKGRNANATKTNKALAKGIGNIAARAEEKYQRAVGDTIPDSGTSGSIISTGSLLGLGGLVGSGAILNPAVLTAIGVVGAKAFQYSPMMVKRFNKMIAREDYRQAADLLERYAITSGAVGVEVNQLINELRQGR
jgi:hypothetical protein